MYWYFLPGLVCFVIFNPALFTQGLTPLIEENVGSAFQFSSSTVQAAEVREVKAQEIRSTESVGTLARGDFKGSKYIPVGEPYGIPGTRGIVPNNKRYRRLMRYQEEWAVCILFQC